MNAGTATTGRGASALRARFGRWLRPWRHSARRLVGVHDPVAVEARHAGAENRLAHLEDRQRDLEQQVAGWATKLDDLTRQLCTVDLSDREQLDTLVDELVEQRRALAALAARLDRRADERSTVGAPRPVGP